MGVLTAASKTMLISNFVPKHFMLSVKEESLECTVEVNKTLTLT